MIKTRSDALLVWMVNTSPGGGSAVTITNSSNLFITNTSLTVLVQNSAGWVVNVANTGGTTTILNSGGLFAMQSGTWNVTQVSTGRTAIILNSGGLFAMQSGTWSVTQVSTGRTAIILNSGGLFAMQSGTWLVGASSTIMNSSRLVSTYDVTYAMDGTALVTMQYGTINITNSTNTVIVKAITNNRIKVMSLFLVSQGTGLLTWQSGSSSGIGLTGPVYLGVNVGYVLPFNPNGWFQTGVETLLNANLTTPTSIGGCIAYLATS